MEGAAPRIVAMRNVSVSAGNLTLEGRRPHTHPTRPGEAKAVWMESVP
jgi:hypothetical protein